MIELLLDAERALALGLLDQAERTYRSVLEADPRNGIAAVGLSRVALERGDEAGALALARAALDIDPDNATARRMVDRLEEVARFRAAPPADPPTEPSSGAPPEPPGGAVASESMIREPAVATVALAGTTAVFSAADEPGSGQPEHAESEADQAVGTPTVGAGSAAATPAAPTHESSTESQRLGLAASSAASSAAPSAAGATAHPARPGLLRRILRRS